VTTRELGRAWVPPRLSRREFLAAGAAGVAAAVGAACSGRSSNGLGPDARQAQLFARPGTPTGSVSPGLQALGLADRDAFLYVPESYAAPAPSTLVLTLHGAGGSPQGELSMLRPHADEHGWLLLAPYSRGHTWDLILGGYGPDVTFIDRALAEVFRRSAVDPARVTIEGFSDGATYALSLGVTNGDLFQRIIAFSPGFMAAAAPRGDPRIFISHGTGDRILPIDATSRRIVSELERASYDVEYREFDGGHTVQPSIVLDAVRWLTGA
jgi:phospholipase/carboxylesterase